MTDGASPLVTSRRIGRWQVHAIHAGGQRLDGGAMFGVVPKPLWQRRIAPDDRNRIPLAMRCLVIEHDTGPILIDTGAGNKEDAKFHDIYGIENRGTDGRTRLEDGLRQIGMRPEDITLVINTHLHFDHVGWNTTRDGDAWVPTFPNARYLVPEPDYRHFEPGGTAQRKEPQTEDEQSRQRHVRTYFADSVSPVGDQIELWSDGLALSESLWLRPAPGHTPGSSVVWLDAGKPAVFVGDLTHCPIQLDRPSDPCSWDEDFAVAAATRKRVLTEAARRRAAVIPAHYPGHGGATVVARGDAFMVDDWLGLPLI
jgi:glyoxylase-like metal-dependent hydrolase (beta-lactamase superfamily II)